MSLPSRCLHAAVHAKFSISAHLAPKGAINGQGFYQKCQLDGQKGAISDKEIAIFELRKVLFPDKHLRELPGASENPDKSRPNLVTTKIANRQPDLRSHNQVTSYTMI
jgi:hypothetical protein